MTGPRALGVFSLMETISPAAAAAVPTIFPWAMLPVAAVTARIRERSAPTRQAYLARLDAIARRPRGSAAKVNAPRGPKAPAGEHRRAE